ncbi:hypothetical protein F5146DRAFT_927554 [Armillaria mellea]|nr:hypothetical protein F5146DRAFT_927554 [Armillaria mellea]
MNNICLVCLQNPKRDKYQFCSKFCTDRAARTAPQLLLVPDDHVMYRDVAALFVNNWDRNTGPLPRIAYIYLITWSSSLRKSFDNYRTSMCHLCGAIKTGFKTTLDYKRSMSPMQQRGVRFGRGIYMAASSSKAFQYAKNGDSRSRYKAVLVTRAVLGNPQRLYEEDHQMEEPDEGYHSVSINFGGVGPIEDVVFNHNAVRPAYLIIVKQ